MNRVTVLLVLASVFSCTCAAQAADDYDLRCGYNGDMCDINPEDCLRKMRVKKQRIRHCRGLSNGPGKLYNTRKDVTFWIHIDEKMRGEYPKNLTYTIYNKIEPRNWTIPNSLSKIADCCGLTENDTCRLPKRKPGEIQLVFMPVQDQGDYKYCQYELQEKSETIKWCDDDDQMGCLEVLNGTLQFRSHTIPLNFVDGKWLVDYCFYASPKTYTDREGTSTFSDDTTTINITGNNIFASLQGGEMIPCEKHESFSRDVLKHPVLHRIKRETDFACFFVRTPNQNEEWLKNPGCVNMTAVSELTVEPVDANGGLVAIIVIVIACSIVLAVVIGLMWLYKKHLKKCTFKRTMQELPDTLAMEKTHLDKDVNIEVTTKPKKEIVDEITFLETVRAVEMEEESTTEKVDLLRDESRSESVETSGKATIIENQDAADSGFPTSPTEKELADQEHDESPTFPTIYGRQDDSGISSGFSKIEFNSSDAYTDKNSLTVEPQEADANQFRQTTPGI